MGKIEDASNKEKIVQASIGCFVTLFVNLAGGLILAWWLYKYHPDNRQLWMVPFGLILFVTPVLVWFSVVFSDICNPDRKEGIPNPSDNSIPDPEK